MCDIEVDTLLTGRHACLERASAGRDRSCLIIVVKEILNFNEQHLYLATWPLITLRARPA